MLSQEPIQADRFVPKHPKLPLSLSSSCAFSAGKRKDAKIRKINWLLKVCQLRRRPWFSTRDTGRVEDAQLGYLSYLLYFSLFLTCLAFFQPALLFLQYGDQSWTYVKRGKLDFHLLLRSRHVQDEWMSQRIESCRNMSMWQMANLQMCRVCQSSDLH